MGGRFAARVAGYRVAPELTRVERLSTDRRYAFVNHDNPWVARLDGRFVGRFDVSMGLSRTVTWSPDGRLIYAAGRDGLYRLDPYSHDAVCVHRRDDIRQIAVSPDGGSVVFRVNWSLFRLELASGELTTLSAIGGWCLDVDWERGHVVCVHGDLFAIDLSSGARSLIALPTLRTPVGSCHVRSDGAGTTFQRHTAPVSMAADGRAAYVRNLSELRIVDDRGDRPLAWIPGRHPAAPALVFEPHLYAPTWSADGRLVAATLVRLRRRAIEREGVELLDAASDEYEAARRAALALEPLESYLIVVDLETGEVGERHPLAGTPRFAPC